MPSFVQLFRAAKGVWIDPDATEGAVVGENLFLRLDDGTLALFQPTDGTVVVGDGMSSQVRLGNPAIASRSLGRSGRSGGGGAGVTVAPSSNRFAATLRRAMGFALPGSNSGYLPASSPATPRSGFDLDPLMIAGLPGALDPYPSVPDTAHGFPVGAIVRLNGTDYVKSQANNAVNAEVVGMVAGIDDANHFRICPGGRVTGLPAGLVAGAVYFLSPTTAGTMTLVEPSALGQVTKPVFIADGPTSGYFINMRGQVIGGAPVTAARPAFMAGINSATDASVATGGTVPFNLTSFDTTSMFNPATFTATAVTPGNYQLGFTIYFTNSAGATNQMHVGAYKNGVATTVGPDTPMWLTATPNSMGGVICMSCVGLVMAAAGDTFKIVNTAAGILRHYQGHSAFWMRYVDP